MEAEAEDEAASEDEVEAANEEEDASAVEAEDEDAGEDNAIAVAASLEDEESGIAAVSEDEDTDVIASGTCGDDLTWVLDGDYVLTISGTGEMGNYSAGRNLYQSGYVYYSFAPWGDYRESITAVVIDTGVTKIGEYAFYGCSALTSVCISDSVLEIDTYAFGCCANLNDVALGNGLTKIGEAAFFECTRLDSITIPASVTSIGSRAFIYCSGLASVSIGNAVTSIDSYAFYECESLVNMVIPDNVTSIGEFVFTGCTSLESITIGSGVTKIGGSYGEYSAFTDCSALTSIIVSTDNPTYSSIDGILFDKEQTQLIKYPAGNLRTSYVVPDTVTVIGRYAFSYCTNLTNVKISDNVVSIGDYAFYKCSGLTELTISNNATGIGTASFLGCSSLTTVTIPDSVTSIGKSAFNNCYNLINIIIGGGVTSIKDYAFQYCTSLTDVYYIGSEEDWNTIDIGNYNERLTNATIHYNSTGPEDDDDDDTDTEKLTMISEINVSKYDEDQSAYTDTYDSLEIGDALLLSVEVTVDEDTTPAFDVSDWECDDEAVLALGDLSVVGPQTSEDYDGMVVYYISITADVVGDGTATVTFTAPNNREVSVEIAVGEDEDTTPESTLYSAVKDGWCIKNTYVSFGYDSDYSIDLSAYFATDISVLDVVRSKIGESVLSIFTGHKWGGSCFGLSLLSVAAYNGQIDLSAYFDSDGDTLNTYGYESISEIINKTDGTSVGNAYVLAGNTEVISVIENAHVSQLSEEMSDIEVGRNDSDYSTAIQYMCNNKTPLLITMTFNKKFGGHAIVVDLSRDYTRYEEWYGFYVYDCNSPSLTNELENGAYWYDRAQSMLYLNPDTGEWVFYADYNNDGELEEYDRNNYYAISLSPVTIHFYDVSQLDSSFFYGSNTLHLIDDIAIIESPGILTVYNSTGEAVVSIEDGEVVSCAEETNLMVYAETIEDSGTPTYYGTLESGQYTYVTDGEASVLRSCGEEYLYAFYVDGASEISVDDATQTITLSNTGSDDVTFVVALQDTDGVAIASAEGVLEPEGAFTIQLEQDGDTFTANASTTSDPTLIVSELTISGEQENLDYHYPDCAHEYDAEFAWSDEYTSCTVTLTCSVCGDIVTLDASVTSEVDTDATCTESGATVYTATVTLDGITYTDTRKVSDIDVTAHSYDGGEITKAATCTEAGQITYTCTVCGSSYTEELEALGHDAVKVAAKAATDTEDGNIAYWYCESCGKYFSDESLTVEITLAETVISATGDSEDDDDSDSTKVVNTSDSDTSDATSEADTTAAAEDDSTADAATATSSATTGDNYDVTLYSALALAAALGLVGVLIVTRKRKS